jgi:DNA modification methylase
MVMRGERARCIFTDPPYGLGKEIENDNLKREDWVTFYTLFTDNMLDFAIVNSYVFVWGYFDTLSNYWQEVIKPRGDCNFRNFIIWRKKHIQGRNAKEFRQFPEEYEAALLYIFGQPFQNGPWSTSPNAEYYPEIFEPIRVYLDGERQKMGWDIPTTKKIVGHSDLSRDHWFGRSQWTMPTREVYEKFQQAGCGDAFCKDYDELRKDYDELRGYFDNTNGMTDLWEFERQTIDTRHPTVKPVEVCERGIIATSQRGEIVMDVFLGSGTTLIACERLNRKCRAVEISPAYCAVAIQRWVDMTHGEPILLVPQT